MNEFIHQHNHWPECTWDSSKFLSLLSEARNLQGKLVGKMEALGFDVRAEALLDTLTLDVVKSSEIEGELLQPAQVRSSIARRLGLEIAGAVEPDRNVEGVVEMMLDATQNCFSPLTEERLFDWHAALLPTGRSGMRKIIVAGRRQDTCGPMQVVSGAMGKEKVHFQAPGSALLEEEMARFIAWFNASINANANASTGAMDLVIKAAIAHLWFVTIHPFEDGNGRIARALTDMLLARSDESNQRFYSMSAQIRIERKQYYAILEKTQRGDVDITDWIVWFLHCLIRALRATDSNHASVLFKAEFWQKNIHTALNDRQRKLLNKLLDGFDGKLTSSKWAKIAKCSKDSAVRDINDLIEKGILQKDVAGGRSTSYELIGMPTDDEAW